MNCMIITISGTPGSGKSTLAKGLSKTLKIKHYSIGDLMKSLARKRGISLLKFSKLAETDKSIDKQLDDELLKLAKKKNFVIDTRTGFFFIPDSIKIFLKCKTKVAAGRILKDVLKKKRKTESEIKTLRDAIKLVKKRTKSERKRYKKYYGIDFLKKKNYNIILDTTKLTKKETINKTLAKLMKINKLLKINTKLLLL